MKRILFTTIALCVYLITPAQIISNLVLAAQPPAQLSEWSNRREVLTLIMTAQGGAAAQFKIKTEIKTPDGTVIASADLARTTVFTGNPTGATIFTANDAVPLEYMVFNGTYKNTLQRTGKLPAGNYILCTRPVRPGDYVPLGDEQCKTFYLANTQLPILLKPYNEEVLDPKKAQTAILFRWSPVTPVQTSPVTYRIQVFEVLENQNALQALRSNPPLLDKEIIAATQFIWQPQLAFENRKQKFIWTIQSLDKNHNPVSQTDSNGEGRSEPVIFFVESKKKN